MSLMFEICDMVREIGNDGRMEYFGYLLSIKELYDNPDAEKMAERACSKLDTERLGKVLDTQGNLAFGKSLSKRKAQSIGAGLLLQMGLKYGLRREYTETGECTNALTGNGNSTGIKRITLVEVLDNLGEPIEAAYSYGEHGKPCFRSIPLKFNISHSGDYVFCVFSKQEIGADIQYCRLQTDKTMAGIVRRFFSKAEQHKWKEIERTEDKSDYFYQIWTRKEAYGKLTGDGLLVTDGEKRNQRKTFVSGEQCDENIICKTHEFVLNDGEQDKYYTAVCRYS